MQINEVIWSELEQRVAQNAFQTAYQRETASLIKEIRECASMVTELDDIWRLHDFLSARRHDIDGKYDYDYTALLFIFAKLIKEKWLQMDDLHGLDHSKLTKIAALTRI